MSALGLANALHVALCGTHDHYPGHQFEHCGMGAKAVRDHLRAVAADEGGVLLTEDERDDLRDALSSTTDGYHRSLRTTDDEEPLTATVERILEARRTAFLDHLDPARPAHDCGHDATEPGCGGCDPGAIEFVITDDGVRRPFDPARDMAARPSDPTEEQAHG